MRISTSCYHQSADIVNFIFRDAEDATNVTILPYLIAAYGTIGSEEADNLCIGRLISERLKD